ncbi:MAG TPA: Ku protein [Vicinamibacterales bacterium]|nr:Ku protein [Vicinamibacterales bacterium]
MSARATWKGYLRVSLVNIPVKVFPATESSATISFNQLHNVCQTRIQQKRWCPTCQKEVAHDDLVKGYEFEKSRYVVVSEEDIEKVRPTSTRIIDLVQFDDATALDPMYVDRTYYLAPDGQVAADAFAVMGEGMKGKIGVGKLALYGREYLVAVKPHKKGLVMYTLHHAAEIRDMGAIEELNTIPAKVKPESVQLAKQVIGTFAKKLDLSDYRDEYREGLQKIIDAKVAGEEVAAPLVEMPPKVVNLMEALRKSLDSVSGQKKQAAKAELPKKVTRAEPKNESKTEPKKKRIS